MKNTVMITEMVRKTQLGIRVIGVAAIVYVGIKQR